MILFKLHRYQRDKQLRTDGMRDDAEWNDILGMLKVQRPDLDLALLEEWAKALDMMGYLATGTRGCSTEPCLSRMGHRQEGGTAEPQ